MRKFRLAIVTCFLTVFWSGVALCAEDAYWIWAGITPSDAPTNAQLYIYQGLVSGEKAQFAFSKKGIFAHPLQAQRVFLTYRFNGPNIDTAEVAKLFATHAHRWSRHKVNVVGIQIDFDAPSSKLHDYAKNMASLKRQLPAEFQLSITGLADWATSQDKTGLKALFDSVDEIVFQMYRVNRHHENINGLLDALEALRHPYKIGLLYSRARECDLTKRNYLNGVVYFIQRQA